MAAANVATSAPTTAQGPPSSRACCRFLSQSGGYLVLKCGLVSGPHCLTLPCLTANLQACYDLGRGAPHFHSASALTLLTLETRWNSPVPVPAGTGCVWCSWKHQDPAWRAKGKQNQGRGQTEERGIMTSSILRAGREEETTPRCKRIGSRKLAFGRKGGMDLLVQVGGREPINPSRQNLRTKPRKPGLGGRSKMGADAGSGGRWPCKGMQA